MRRWLSLLVVAIPAAAVALLWTSPPVTAQPIPAPGLRVVTHGSSMTGSGTVAAPLDLRTDCSSTQGLAWDGDSWECAADANSALVTNGAIPKGNGTTQVASIMTESGGLIGVSGGVYATGVGTYDGNVTMGNGPTDAHVLNGTLNANSTAGAEGEVLTIVSGVPAWAEAAASVIAGTNIDVSGSTVSVEPTVSLAGASTETTLEVLGTGAGEAADGRKLTSIDDTGMTFAGANAAAANSYGLYVSRSGSCSDCTTGNSLDHNLIAGYFDARGDEIGDNAVTNVALYTDKGGTVIGADPANSWVLFGASITVNPDSAVVTDTISSWSSIATSTPGGAEFPGGYTYGAPSGNLDVIAAGNGTTGGGTLTLDATGDGAIVIGSDSDDTLTVNATTTIAQLRGTPQTGALSGEITLNDTATVVFTSSSTSSITGFTGGWDGRVVWVCSTSTTAANLTVIHESGAATAANRIFGGAGANRILRDRSCFTFLYDGDAARWLYTGSDILNSLAVIGTSTFTGAATFNNTATINATATLNSAVVVGNAWADDLDITAETMYQGNAPTLSGCSSSCTMASYSTNHRGRITCTDDSGSDCTVTFADSGWETNPPACSLTFEDATAPSSTPYVRTVSTTAFSFDQNTTGAHAYSYHCDGMI